MALHPMSKSKIPLHVEQFSLKNDWKLAERVLPDQVGGKTHRESGRKGREVGRSEPVPLGGDSEKKGEPGRSSSLGSE